MSIHPPPFAVAPAALIAALLLVQVGLRTARAPSAAAAADPSAPIRLPRAIPAPSDPQEWRLHHAARMIRRADAAAALGQFELAVPWLMQAYACAQPVARHGATQDRRRRARALVELSSRRLRGMGRFRPG